MAKQEKLSDADLLPGCAREFGEINVELDDIKAKMENIDKHLSGNGKPGIRIELDRIMQDNKDEKKARERGIIVVWTALGTVCTGVILLLIKTLIGG